jgi:hypothetical protein
VDTGAMQHLHGRVEDLCRNSITLQNCKWIIYMLRNNWEY